MAKLVLDWDDANPQKCQKHGLSFGEIVLSHSRLFVVPNRMGSELLDAVRKSAKREGIRCQRSIRQAVERAVAERKR